MRATVVAFAGIGISTDWTLLQPGPEPAQGMDADADSGADSGTDAAQELGMRAARQADELWHDFLVAHFNRLGGAAEADDAAGAVGAGDGDSSRDDAGGAASTATGGTVTAEATADAARAYEGAFMSMM